MTDITARLSLPLLSVGQAQKEITHNEALTRIDALVQPVVESIAPASVPSTPVIGRCWIVGTGATGAWAGNDGALANWTEGGWRFVPAFPGMSVWSIADNMVVTRQGATWQKGQINASMVSVNGTKVVGAQRPAIASVAGGTVIDQQARLAITAILDAMIAHGLIAP